MTLFPAGFQNSDREASFLYLMKFHPGLAMLHIFQDAFYLLMLPSSRVCDGLQEAPLNKTALICTTDTP